MTPGVTFVLLAVGCFIWTANGSDLSCIRLNSLQGKQVPDDSSFGRFVQFGEYMTMSPNLDPKLEGEEITLILHHQNSCNPYSAWCNIQSCTVTLPNGTKISREKNNTSSRVRFSDCRDRCAVTIKDLELNDEGNWTLKSGNMVNQISQKTAPLRIKIIETIPTRLVVKLNETATFVVNKLPTKTKSIEYESCEVLAPNGKTYHLAGLMSNNSEISKTVVYSGRGLVKNECGAQIGSILPEFNGTWTFRVKLARHAKYFTSNSEMIIKDDPKNTTKLVIAELGKEIMFFCGPEDALQCSMTNPSNKTLEFMHGCLYGGNARHSDKGKWKCKSLVPQSHEPVFSTVIVTFSDETDVVELEAKEDDTNVNLICIARFSTPNNSISPYECVMQRPDGLNINVRKAVTTTGIMTRYNKLQNETIRGADCSMSIRKPLLKEDYGSWRCILVIYESRSPLGGFIDVTPSKDSEFTFPAPKVIFNTNPVNGIALSGTQIDFTFDVNRPLSYCWLRQPNGEQLIYTDADNLADAGNLGLPAEIASLISHLSRGEHTMSQMVSIGGGRNLGECGYEYRKVNRSNHSGTWVFSVGLITGKNRSVEEHQFRFNLTVTDSLIMAKRNRVFTSLGKPATLECLIPESVPVRFCIFDMPNGTALSLVDGYKNGRYSQDGVGIRHGRCSLKIESAQDLDFGEWVCSISAKNDLSQKRTSKILLLNRIPPSLQLSAVSADAADSTVQMRDNLLILNIICGCLLFAILILVLFKYSSYFCSQRKSLIGTDMELIHPRNVNEK